MIVAFVKNDIAGSCGDIRVLDSIEIAKKSFGRSVKSAEFDDIRSGLSLHVVGHFSVVKGFTPFAEQVYPASECVLAWDDAVAAANAADQVDPGVLSDKLEEVSFEESEVDQNADCG